MKKRVMRVCMILFAVIVSIAATTMAQAKKKTKTVKKTSLKKATITLSKKTYTYTGKKKKPTVTVKVGKKTIKKSKNYTVTYKSNKTAGKAKVVVKAKKGSKKLSGSKTIKFTIKKASRKLIADRTEYTAVEGDGAFNVTAKASKGGGTIKYSTSDKKVVKVDSTGLVTVVAEGTATIKMTVAATKNYKAASTSVTVKVTKKVIVVDSEASIRNFDYDSQITRFKSETPYTAIESHSLCAFYKLTEFAWSVLSKYSILGTGPMADICLVNHYTKCNNLCPQGMCFADDYLLTTAYCQDSLNTHNSCIFIYDRNTGEYLKTLELSMASHVGGITFDGENIWICHATDSNLKESEQRTLQRIGYDELKKYAEGNKGIVEVDDVELNSLTVSDVFCKPSAITYDATTGYIWVAKFVSLANYEAYYSEKIESELPCMWAFEYAENESGKKELRPARRDVLLADSPSEGYLGAKTSDYVAEDPQDAVQKGVLVESINAGEKLKFSVSGDNATDDSIVLQKGDIIVGLEQKTVENVKEMEEIFEERYQSQGEDDLLVMAIAIMRKVSGDNGEQEWKKITGTVELGQYKRTELVPKREIPNRIQGLTFSEDGTKLLLSRSYGRSRRETAYISEILVYDWDINETELGQPLRSIIVPPMVEQIEMRDNRLYMIFESAATGYVEGTHKPSYGKSECPIDKLVSIPLSFD